MSTRLEAARSASSHLSSTQIEDLRRLLAEEHALQRTRAAELRDTEDLEPDLAEVLLARCQEALEETEAALDLIEREVYGLCAECGAPIPYERLEVVPATRRCVACQSGRDRVLR